MLCSYRTVLYWYEYVNTNENVNEQSKRAIHATRSTCHQSNDGQRTNFRATEIGTLFTWLGVSYWRASSLLVCDVMMDCARCACAALQNLCAGGSWRRIESNELDDCVRLSTEIEE